MKTKLTVGTFKIKNGPTTGIPKFNQFPKHFFCGNGEVINLTNGNLVKPYVKDNHLWIALNYKGKRVQAKLGYLMALLYLPNPKNYKYLTYKDGNMKNVSINNLAWVSEKNKKTSQNLDTIIFWLAIALLVSLIGFVTMLIFTFLS